LTPVGAINDAFRSAIRGGLLKTAQRLLDIHGDGLRVQYETIVDELRDVMEYGDDHIEQVVLLISLEGAIRPRY
jgi:hypothetical protein